MSKYVISHMFLHDLPAYVSTLVVGGGYSRPHPENPAIPQMLNSAKLPRRTDGGFKNARVGQLRLPGSFLNAINFYKR